jgi:hypothetical protein
MARPSKLTPEVEKKIIDAIRTGNYYEAACAYAGINYTTFYRWMEKGEKAKSGKFCKFCKAVKQAEGDAEARIVYQWASKTPEDWRAAQAFLERRYPERWGKKDIVKHQGDNEKPITYTVKFVDGHPDPDHREIREVSEPDPEKN